MSRFADTHFSKTNTLLAIFLAISTSSPTIASPPHYESFERDQKLSLLNEDGTALIKSHELLQIWIIYAEDAQATLIRYPQTDPKSDRTEVLIDAGSNKPQGLDRVYDIIRALNPNKSHYEIEFAVMTSPTESNLVGFTRILDAQDMTIGQIYHNGLAYYNSTQSPFNDGLLGDKAVYDAAKNKVIRGIASTRKDGSSRFVLDNKFLIQSAAALKARQGVFEGEYLAFAKAALTRSVSFNRAYRQSAFADHTEVGRRADVAFDVLWPPEKNLTAYGKGGKWHQTITGNGISFRLKYKNFEFLMTGDHRPAAIREMFATISAQAMASCDVLKIPNQGRRVTDKQFSALELLYKSANPVLSIVSASPTNLRADPRPSARQVLSLGRAHRVYSTHLHEQVIDWNAFTKESSFSSKYVEKTNIVIETDGEWFRLVEIPILNGVAKIPPIKQTLRGDGTRWIRAK